MQQYLIQPEVAKILRVPTETLRYYRRIGTGPKSFKAGKRILYTVEDVEAFLAAARIVDAR